MTGMLYLIFSVLAASEWRGPDMCFVGPQQHVSLAEFQFEECLCGRKQQMYCDWVVRTPENHIEYPLFKLTRPNNRVTNK